MLLYCDNCLEFFAGQEMLYCDYCNSDLCLDCFGEGDFGRHMCEECLREIQEDSGELFI